MTKIWDIFLHKLPGHTDPRLELVSIYLDGDHCHNHLDQMTQFQLQ